MGRATLARASTKNHGPPLVCPRIVPPLRRNTAPLPFTSAYSTLSPSLSVRVTLFGVTWGFWA
jgi:hypothetical protein